MGNEIRLKIFISAAEVSGDNHCAQLIKQLHKEPYKIMCQGLGGPAMEAAGCKLLENLVVKSAMLTHAIKQIGFYYKLRGRVKQHFLDDRPDLVVVADSPAWNFHVAKAAKQLQIPVLYYIAPQLWAWGAWRTGKLRRCADRLACILPFEQQWFRDRNIKANYVGHPLFDDERTIEIAKRSPESRNFPTIALLPGSRQHEIDKLWGPMQKIARKIRSEMDGAHFITAATDDSYAEILSENADPSLAIDIRPRSIEAATRHADLALVASGTATLEVAAQSCPMIVMYHVGKLHWHLAGRWLIKTKHISLVNILADKQLVPEFIPFGGREKAVGEMALAMLGDAEELGQRRVALRELLKPIVVPGAAENVVKIIKQMLDLP